MSETYAIRQKVYIPAGNVTGVIAERRGDKYLVKFVYRGYQQSAVLYPGELRASQAAKDKTA